MIQLHLLSIHWFINPLMMIPMLVILLYSSLIAISLRTIILISFQKKRHWQISLRINPIQFIEIKRDLLQFSLLNTCIEKTGPKALQVSRSAAIEIVLLGQKMLELPAIKETKSFFFFWSASWKVRNLLLKGLDQSALLSDKEHLLVEPRTPTEHPWRMEQDDEEGGEGMEENLGREQGDLWKGKARK